ncbi:hypothetical protein F4782DRAFT_535588 [Xylaria castorea]|nr:hypothetical protein F4782DRAFT_535588 [Xylaria castorea]
MTTVLNTGVTILGTYLEMQWHETDLSSFPESLAASLRVGMGLPAFTTKSMPTVPTESNPAGASNHTEHQNSSVHISKGTIAGIGAGVGVAVLLIGAPGYLALSRRWKRPGHEVEEQDKTTPTIYQRWIRVKTSTNTSEAVLGGLNFLGHTRNPNDNSQVGHDHGSTGIVEDPIELEGSVPVRQETVPEAVSEAGQGQNGSQHSVSIA